jgi:hypothetical protein
MVEGLLSLTLCLVFKVSFATYGFDGIKASETQQHIGLTSNARFVSLLVEVPRDKDRSTPPPQASNDSIGRAQHAKMKRCFLKKKMVCIVGESRGFD